MSCNESQGLSHKMAGHTGYHLSKHIKSIDSCRKSITLNFNFDLFADTLGIDTFMVIFDDGYIYKGNFKKNIRVDSLCLDQEYFILYFVGLNVNKQIAYVWSQKRTYNISKNEKFFVLLKKDGSCQIKNDDFLLPLFYLINKF